MIEVTLPDGTVVEFPDGTPPEVMKAAAAKAGKSTAMGAVKQFGAGLTRGAEGLFGAPSDLLEMGVNQLARAEGGDDIPPLNVPGGRDFFEGIDKAAGFSPQPPRGGLERRAGALGEYAGPGAVFGPAGAISGVASGLAAGQTREMGMGPGAEMVATTLAGMAPAAASRAMRPGPIVPTNKELGTQADALWGQVKNSGVRLKPETTQKLKDRVAASNADDIDAGLHTEAVAVKRRVENLPDRPTLYDVEKSRRFVARNAFPSPTDNAAKEKTRLAMGIRGEIDAFLDEVGGPTVAKARNLSRRKLTSESLDETLAKASRRADRVGTSESSTTRARLETVLGSPRKAMEFTKAEQKLIDQIVRGGPLVNNLDRVGVLSPTGGKLSAAVAGGSGAGVAGALAMGRPDIAAIAATPSVIGYIAKQLGETITERQIKKLSAQIRYGGPVPTKGMTEAERNIVEALAAMQLSRTTEQ